MSERGDAHQVEGAVEDVERLLYSFIREGGGVQSTNEAKSLTLEQFVQRLRRDGPKKEVTNRILLYAGATDPLKYDSAFGELRKWLTTTIDIYRGEIVQVMFPLFVYCFLDMIAKDREDGARSFFEKYKSDFIHLHNEEISALSSVFVADHLKENEVAKLFLSRKYPVHMCTYSFALLVSFLQDQNAMSLLNLINKFVAIDIKEGPPTKVGDMIFAHRSIHPESGKEDEIKWATPEYDPFLRDPVDKEKTKPRLAPPLSDKSYYDRVCELSRKATVSSTSLPSICLFSFLNASSLLNACEISPEGRFVVGCFDDNVGRLWDLNYRGHLSEEDAERFDAGVNEADMRNIEDDEEGEGNEMDVDMEVERPKKKEGSSRKRREEPMTLLIGHGAPIYSASFSPDSKYLLTSSGDGDVILWSLLTRRSLVVFKGHGYPVWDVKFSPYGYFFATASRDCTVRMWSTDDTTPLRIFVGHASDINCVEFHPNCNYIASGSSDHTVRLWDIQKGDCVRLFLGHSSCVRSVAFSPKGKYLASGDDEGNIRVWDLVSGDTVTVLECHKSSVYSLCFSSEGNVLASGSADASVCLWRMEGIDTAQMDKETGSSRLLEQYHTKNTPVYKMSFTLRNVLLASGPFGHGQC